MSPANAAPSVDVSVVTFNAARHLTRLAASLACERCRVRGIGADELTLASFVDWQRLVRER